MTLRGTDESIISQRDFAGLIVYLMLSAASAAPLALPDTSVALRIVCGVLLLLGFMVVARLAIGRLRGLGEFEQLIAYRAMAGAGLVAVWFVLAVGLLFSAFGGDNLLLIMALGPPEFWLCAALFARGSEHAYASTESAAP